MGVWSVWLVGQAEGPAWLEGGIEVPFWIVGIAVGAVVGGALWRLGWRASEERGDD